MTDGVLSFDRWLEVGFGGIASPECRQKLLAMIDARAITVGQKILEKVNSLDATEMQMALEERWGIEFSDKFVCNCRTFGKFYRETLRLTGLKQPAI